MLPFLGMLCLISVQSILVAAVLVVVAVAVVSHVDESLRAAALPIIAVDKGGGGIIAFDAEIFFDSVLQFIQLDR